MDSRLEAINCHCIYEDRFACRTKVGGGPLCMCECHDIWISLPRVRMGDGSVVVDGATTPEMQALLDEEREALKARRAAVRATHPVDR